MRLRSSRWAASVLALGMSAAAAIAQPPAAPATDAAYPSEALNYTFDDGGNFYDELDLSSQFRFQADWVSYTRDNQAKNIPLFTGSESVSQRDADFSYQSGYRLNLGFMNEDYELEGSFLKLDGLNSSLNGTLTNAVVFDGEAVFFGGGISNPARDAAGGASANFLESTTLFSAINAAANHVAGALDNETNELEYFDPASVTYQVHYTSNLQDFDVNLKGRRQSGRLLRFGFGYRNIQLNEGGLAALRGEFNTIDVDGNEAGGNDGLSNAAFVAAGLNVVTAGGFSQNTLTPPPDQLLFRSSTNATNQLNGAQATLDATFLESEYFSIGGYAKAGIYHNRARGSITESYQVLENNPPSYTRSFSDGKDRVAFAGNLGVTGTVFLRDNLRLFGGYELMYLSGVALAPDQSGGVQTDIAIVTSLNLQTHGQVLFHGGRVGIEILFP